MMEARTNLYDRAELMLYADFLDALNAKRENERDTLDARQDAPIAATVEEPAPVVEPGAVVPLTIEALVETFTRYATAKGLLAATEMLGRFGVMRLSDLPEAKRAEFITELAK